MNLVSRRRLWTALVLSLGTLSGAWAATVNGSGTLATESRALAGYSAIALRGGIDIVVRQGEREGVQLSGDDNLVPLVQTTLEGSCDARTLRIELKSGESVRPRQKLEVTVDVIRLTGRHRGQGAEDARAVARDLGIVRRARGATRRGAVIDQHCRLG